MKNLFLPLLAALSLGITGASGQQSVLAPYNQTWSFMHPMGVLPDVPPGGDVDFDTTWYLPEAEFATQYNGPEFGATPEIVGDPLVTNSFDSGVSPGPIGYETIDYFGSGGAEVTGFGDDDADPGNGLSGELTQPASGQRRAAYLRTTFTVPPGDGDLVHPVIRYVVDDGAFIYLDGVLVAAINMAANNDTYTGVNAANGTDTETDLRVLDLNLPDGSVTGLAPGDPQVAANARVIRRVAGLTVGEHTLAISVRSNSQTSSDLVGAFELSAEVGCEIDAVVSNPVRSDAGTATNPADDTFTFDVAATAFNGGATWSSDAPGNTGGAYGTPITLGPFPIAQSPRTVTIAAASDPSCTTQVTGTAPGASITPVPESYARDLRASFDPADDTFTALVRVDALFASASWVATGTTPLVASTGTPVGGMYGNAIVFGPYPVSAQPVTVTLVDAVDPSVTTQLVLRAPDFLGGKSLGGALTFLLSTAPLPTQWVTNNATPPTITMADAGGDVWREFRSEIINLTTVGAVGFTAELVARETSTGSNFEDVDAFRAKLILTGPSGTTEVNLIAPYDTNANGMINGSPATYNAALDEFNLSGQPVEDALNNIMLLEALIPATANSAQLVVEAKGISSSEFFDVRRVSFSDRCAFSIGISDIVRNSNGQPTNVAAHTLEFLLNVTPTGLVSPFGYTATFTRNGTPVPGANVSDGQYDTDVQVTGIPAEGGPVTVTITDRADPSCTLATLVVVPLAPIAVGTASLGGPVATIFSDGEATYWTAIDGGIEMVDAPGISDFTTEPLDLSSVNGQVYFSMLLRAMEVSTGSNFEAADLFLAELLLDDGVGVTTVNLITPFDTDANGTIEGDTAANFALDEFNPADEPVANQLDNLFPMSATIPDNIVSATLRLRARADSPTEFLRVLDVLFTTTPPIGGGDSDGDGVSDTDELLAGTNPNDAGSFFRVTTLTTAAGTSSAGFATVSGRFYQGYTSTDLVVWTRDDTNPALAGDGNPAVWTLPQTGPPARFLRIAVAAASGDFPATMP